MWHPLDFFLIFSVCLRMWSCSLLLALKGKDEFESMLGLKCQWIWGAEPWSSFCSWLLCLHNWSNQNLGFELFWKGSVTRIPFLCARTVWDSRYSARPSPFAPKNIVFPILCLQYQCDPNFTKTWTDAKQKFSIAINCCHVFSFSNGACSYFCDC